MYEQLKLDRQISFRLYTAARLATQVYHPLLEPLGLTYTQYLVLLVLWEQDHQTVNDISRRLMLDTNTLTPLLQRMERQGLVVRARGLVDGRQTLVSLTKKGLHLEKAAKDIPEAVSDYLKEDTVLAASLDSLIDAMKNPSPDKANL